VSFEAFMYTLLACYFASIIAVISIVLACGLLALRVILRSIK
jgi:hypothetical protein